MLFYLLNDLVSVTRFFAEQRQDDELKISRGEHFRDPHPRSTQEARGKVTVASSPAPEVTAMTAAFKIYRKCISYDTLRVKPFALGHRGCTSQRNRVVGCYGSCRTLRPTSY